MLINYNWLQNYFKTALPSPHELTHNLIFHSFEVEETEREHIVDVDVLPNRAHDCLSHRGIAKEVSALFSLPLEKDQLSIAPKNLPSSNILNIEIENPEYCRRYMGAVIRGVNVGSSPEWLKERLESLGQKSINNIVDALNFTMLDLGQPLHSFDMARLGEYSGKKKILIRQGKKQGEELLGLDGITYCLGEGDTLIVDGIKNEVIGIAGVKGGEESGTHNNTTDIIIESANFNPVSVRQTSRRIKCRTDASARFENEPSPELAYYGLNEAVQLILEISGGEVEGYVDVYPKKQKKKEVSFSVDDANNLLGVNINEKEIEEILKRFCFHYKKLISSNYKVTIPFERLDLSIKEDLIEEIGRIYGYEHIKPILSDKPNATPEINKLFYYKEKVRDALIDLGFSEVYTHSLQDTGLVYTENPLASDKGALRRELSGGVKEALVLNARNAELLGLDKIKIFEIGIVFTKEKEYTSLVFGIAPSDNPGRLLQKTVDSLTNTLGLAFPVHTGGGAVYEVNFDELIKDVPNPTSLCDTFKKSSPTVTYTPFSLYPFVLRDIALWVPKGVGVDELYEVIDEKAGNLLVKKRLFDTFEKNEKISYAFHLVFQSYEKTLTDSEVNKVMETVTESCESRGWEVR